MVQPDGTVQSRNVKILATEGETSAVSGVEAGQELVTDGFDKLQNGSKIVASPDRRRRRPSAPAKKHRMNPSRPFILRPIATSLLMAAILLVGIIGFRQLPIAALPEVDYPTMQVLTFYPGASADVVATAITAPLERQLGEVPGLNQMLSTSADGASVITLQFNLSLNIDVAEQDVQEAINAAQNYLPSQLPMPPVYNKVNPADAPILTLALTSDSMPLCSKSRITPTRAWRRKSPSCRASAR